MGIFSSAKMSATIGTPCPLGLAICPAASWTWYEIVAVVCMVEWGLIHLVAMVMTVRPASRDEPNEVVKTVQDALPSELAARYTKENLTRLPLSGRILLQHGLNLGWCGFISCFTPLVMDSVVFNRFAFWFALPCLLADWSYWVALDLTDTIGPVGQAQTFVVSTGMLCIAYGIRERYALAGMYAVGDGEMAMQVILAAGLFFVGLIAQLAKLCNSEPFSCLVCVPYAESAVIDTVSASEVEAV